MTNIEPVKLGPNDTVIAVVPERCRGPGWSNEVVWVHIVDTVTRRLRSECLQGDALSPQLWTLFAPGALMVKALKGAITTERERC